MHIVGDENAPAFDVSKALGILEPICLLITIQDAAQNLFEILFRSLDASLVRMHDAEVIVSLFEILKVAVEERGKFEPFEEANWVGQQTVLALESVIRKRNDILTQKISAPFIRSLKILSRVDGFDAMSIEKLLWKKVREEDIGGGIMFSYGSVIGLLRGEEITDPEYKMEYLLSLFPQYFDNRWVAESIGGTISALVNKAKDDDLSDRLLNMALPRACGGVHELTPSSVILGWMAIKGGGARGNTAAMDAAVRLLQATARDGNLCASSLAGVKYVVEDELIFLYGEGYAVISPLYKQKLFSFLLSPLDQYIGKTNEALCLDQLLSIFGCLLVSVPSEVVLDNRDTVFPMVFKGLEGTNVDVKLSSLLLLPKLWENIAIRESFSLIIGNFIGQVVVALCDSRSKLLRKAAADCLACISTFPHEKIYPHSEHVLSALDSGVSDRKKMVRKAAVRARAFWLRIGDQG
mmetsp:Transcript_18656/g.47084  ORF Transcript_18656/g.47084 Transcript_18656/m.47084 type:complete len:465 (-) Transcript_18656:1522-2916(-)